MPTIRIVTVESSDPAVFEVSKDDARLVPHLLRDPNEVLAFTPKNGGTAYIPVRNVTYLHVDED